MPPASLPRAAAISHKLLRTAALALAPWAALAAAWVAMAAAVRYSPAVRHQLVAYRGSPLATQLLALPLKAMHVPVLKAEVSAKHKRNDSDSDYSDDLEAQLLPCASCGGVGVGSLSDSAASLTKIKAEVGPTSPAGRGRWWTRRWSSLSQRSQRHRAAVKGAGLLSPRSSRALQGAGGWAPRLPLLALLLAVPLLAGLGAAGAAALRLPFLHLQLGLMHLLCA